jgi:hypothetical protein
LPVLLDRVLEERDRLLDYPLERVEQHVGVARICDRLLDGAP